MNKNCRNQNCLALPFGRRLLTTDKRGWLVDRTGRAQNVTVSSDLRKPGDTLMPIRAGPDLYLTGLALAASAIVTTGDKLLKTNRQHARHGLVAAAIEGDP